MLPLLYPAFPAMFVRNFMQNNKETEIAIRRKAHPNQNAPKIDIHMEAKTGDSQ